MRQEQVLCRKIKEHTLTQRDVQRLSEQQLKSTIMTDGGALLHVVAQYGTTEMLNWVITALKDQAPIVCAMLLDDHWTALHLVARYQNSAAVRLILAALGPQASKVCAMPNKDDWTPLHLVARYHESDVVRTMLAALGPQASKVCAMPNKDDWTPLHLAACYHESDVVRAVLVALGPQAKRALALKTKNGFTPQGLSKLASKSSGIEAMLADPEPYLYPTSTLPQVDSHPSAWNDSCETKQCLPERDTSMNEKNNLANMALLRAASKGQLRKVESLLKSNASVNQKDKYGQTALLRAALAGYLETVECLLQHNPLINEKDISGCTALMMAAQEGHYEIVQCLLKNDATSIDEQNNEGNTALMMAAQEGHYEIVQCFLKNDATSIDEQDNEGNTALMMAAKNGHFKAVECLVAHQASIFVKNIHNKTVFDILQTLMLYGISDSEEDSDTPSEVSSSDLNTYESLYNYLHECKKAAQKVENTFKNDKPFFMRNTVVNTYKPQVSSTSTLNTLSKTFKAFVLPDHKALPPSRKKRKLDENKQIMPPKNPQSNPKKTSRLIYNFR